MLFKIKCNIREESIIITSSSDDSKAAMTGVGYDQAVSCWKGEDGSM